MSDRSAETRSASAAAPGTPVPAAGDQPPDSDLRRRAAWLLAMLIVVAVLFVVVMTTLFTSSSRSPDAHGGRDDTAGALPSTSAAPPSPTARSSPPTTASTSAADRTTRSCPGTDACILQGDPARTAAAINDYRRSNGLTALPTRVTRAAQRCALSDGSTCSGNWAETFVATLDGKLAVTKLQSRAHLLDASTTSFEIGWAFDPRTHRYFLAVVRNT